MPKKPTWEEIESWPAEKQRAWLLNICPEQMKPAYIQILNKSELDRSNLLLSHLFFQVQLIKHTLDKPTRKDYLDGMRIFQTKIQTELHKKNVVGWKEFIKSPTGITLGIVILLLILNLLK